MLFIWQSSQIEQIVYKLQKIFENNLNSFIHTLCLQKICES